MRTAIDKFKIHTKWGKVLSREQEQPVALDKGLGRLQGAQPFLFGRLVASSAGVVREMERPVDTQVVLERTEMDGRGFGVPESVFFDSGRFVMYYHSGHTTGLGRAESTDGIHWESRRLVNASLSVGLESCVLLDEYEEDPRFKWKMTGSCLHPSNSLCFYSSADGIAWTQHGGGVNVSGRFADTLPCLYRDGPGEDYHLIKRYEPPNPANEGRGIRGSEVSSGTLGAVLASVDRQVHWDTRVLSSFVLDMRGGGAEMFRRQLYSLSRTLLPRSGYLGVAQVYEFAERTQSLAEVERDLASARELGLEEDFDSVHLYLMPSGDGVHFDPSWVYAGVRLLPDDATRGLHFFSQAGQVLTRDGFHWFYYDVTEGRHNWRWSKECKIALARFREGRLVRLRPVGEGGGAVVTHSFVFDPDQRLTLDVASATESSQIRAELLPADGGSDALGLLTAPSVAAAEPILGANGTAVVRWRGDTGPLRERKVHLRLSLVGVNLYGFALGSATPSD